jgi:hypothetical protein
MSLELEIQKLTDAVQALTGAIETILTPPVAAPVVEVKPAPVAKAKPAPVVVDTSPSEIDPPAPVMPAAPVFEAPAPVAAPVAANKAPFNDGKSLITYVMDVYKQLGAEKGSGIQNVLVTLGYQNINDVKPEHYDALYAGIEALK